MPLCVRIPDHAYEASVLATHRRAVSLLEPRRSGGGRCWGPGDYAAWRRRADRRHRRKALAKVQRRHERHVRG